MNANELFRKIKYLNPKIYKISGHYYFLGMALFQKCNKDEIVSYNAYKNELNKLKEMTQGKIEDVDSIHLREISEFLKQIDDYHKFGSLSDKNTQNANRKLQKLLTSISLTECEALTAQIEDYTIVSQLKDRYYFDNSNNSLKGTNQNETSASNP